MCISSGNFWKKHIFQKDFLQASKPGRGRELTKERPCCANSVIFEPLLNAVLVDVAELPTKLASEQSQGIGREDP